MRPLVPTAGFLLLFLFVPAASAGSASWQYPSATPMVLVLDDSATSLAMSASDAVFGPDVPVEACLYDGARLVRCEAACGPLFVVLPPDDAFDRVEVQVPALMVTDGGSCAATTGTVSVSVQ